jgi:hypothetical protein
MGVPEIWAYLSHLATEGLEVNRNKVKGKFSLFGKRTERDTVIHRRQIALNEAIGSPVPHV